MEQMFVTGVPHGCFGVELSFGAGRTGSVVTTEGPCFHWPWMEIRLISQAIVTSRRFLTYRSCLGTSVKGRYSVQFCEGLLADAPPRRPPVSSGRIEY